MMALSRTARASDDSILGISTLIQEYAASPKDWHLKDNPRYKFWDYALALKLIKDNEIKSILDIGLSNSDPVFKTILKNNSITLLEIPYFDLAKLPIRENKYSLVTCFGIIEHVELKRAFFIKLLKHVSIGGLLLLTTDNESSKKNRKRIIESQDLIDLSIQAELLGYELYNMEMDYLDSNKIELMSLILKRIGK